MSKRGLPGVSKGYGVTLPARPAPLVADMWSGSITPGHAWCANCYRHGHPAYLCPAPHRQDWPTPASAGRLLPPARAPPPVSTSMELDVLDVEVTWTGGDSCMCDECYGKRAALRLINR